MGRYLKNTEIRQADQYSVRVPFGETDTRPTIPLTGQFRYNTTLDVLEVYANDAWQFFSMVGEVEIVKDVFTGDGSTTSFGYMSYAYEAGQEAQVMVFIGNVYQNPGISYMFNSTRTITFTSAVPISHSIVILHNFASTANPAIPDIPYQIPNLTAWYKFNTGIAEISGTVSLWEDQSGNGYNLQQTTPGSRPTVTNGILTFDGLDDWLGHATVPRTHPNTLYLRMKFDAISLAYLSTASNTGHFIFYRENASGQHRLNSGLELSVFDGAEDTWVSVVCVFNSTNSYYEEYNITSTSGNVGTSESNGLSIGDGYGGTAAPASVSVKEIILYSTAHDVTTRTKILDYLDTL